MVNYGDNSVNGRTQFKTWVKRKQKNTIENVQEPEKKQHCGQIMGPW